MLLALALAGCTSRATGPEVLACRLISYTTAQLEACACTPDVEPDGVLTALAAAPGAYGALRPVTVSLDGMVVERGTTGSLGDLAMIVAIPGRDRSRLSQGITLVIEVDGSVSRVWVRGAKESFLELEDEALREVDADGRIEGPARFRPLRHDGVERGDTSPITRVFAANVDEPSASVFVPTPALGETFRASVRGIEHDLVLIGAVHEDGDMSGCWRPDYDYGTCPPGESCEGDWGELGVSRARCSERRRSRGECRPDPRAEVPDGGPPDGGPLDADLPDAHPF